MERREEILYFINIFFQTARLFAWQKNITARFNNRQIKNLHMLLDDFKGKLTTSNGARSPNLDLYTDFLIA